jgi:hypothetical protein
LSVVDSKLQESWTSLRRCFSENKIMPEFQGRGEKFLAQMLGLQPTQEKKNKRKRPDETSQVKNTPLHEIKPKASRSQQLIRSVPHPVERREESSDSDAEASSEEESGEEETPKKPKKAASAAAPKKTAAPKNAESSEEEDSSDEEKSSDEEDDKKKTTAKKDEESSDEEDSSEEEDEDEDKEKGKRQVKRMKMSRG